MNSITIIMVGYLYNTPPALTFIQALCTEKYNVTVVAAGENHKENFPGYSFDNVIFENIIGEYDNSISLPQKMIRMFSIRKRIWSMLNSPKHQNDLIVAISEVTIKHLGMAITGRRYIYYQLELIKDISYIPHFSLWRIDAVKIANKAQKVIVCEYNRAHITKTWWKMKELPVVIMNKPYVPFSAIDEIPEEVKEKVEGVREKAHGRKIVLYQGVVSKQRPIEPFIDAVALHKDEYCFVLVSNNLPNREYDSELLIHVPFIKPPYHMEITKLADIGILTYVSGGNSSYSELNPIYCAPNKVWEYARFGVPMLSNDLPGLKWEFDKNGIGFCVPRMDPEDIAMGYKNIISRREEYSSNAKKYYESYNVEEIIRTTVDECNKSME